MFYVRWLFVRDIRPVLCFILFWCWELVHFCCCDLRSDLHSNSNICILILHCVVVFILVWIRSLRLSFHTLDIALILNLFLLLHLFIAWSCLFIARRWILLSFVRSFCSTSGSTRIVVNWTEFVLEDCWVTFPLNWFLLRWVMIEYSYRIRMCSS